MFSRQDPLSWVYVIVVQDIYCTCVVLHSNLVNDENHLKMDPKVSS